MSLLVIVFAKMIALLVAAVFLSLLTTFCIHWFMPIDPLLTQRLFVIYTLVLIILFIVE